MIAGAIRRSYDADAQDGKEYIKVIRPRIDDLWEFK
jgi:hypothetical protein